MLDNAEHLLNDSSQSIFSSCLLEITHQNPSLRGLITSRSRIGIEGEQILAVPPLPLPNEGEDNLDVLRNYSSVQIFLDRARETKSDFLLNHRNASAITSICRTFDGLPLAIELAASWVWALTPQKMLERFNGAISLQARGGKGVVDRHRMLRSTLESSILMLKQEDRLKFASLALFRGGFTLDAATSLLKAISPDNQSDMDEDTIRIKNMMDHSLITCFEGADNTVRFRMLEPIRELAWEMVEAGSSKKSIREYHFNWALMLCSQAFPHLENTNSPHWIKVLSAEWPNIQAAMSYGMKHCPEHKESVVQLVSMLWRYWYWMGIWTDGRAWLSKALSEEVSPSAHKAEAIYGAGWTAYSQGDYGVASAYLEQSCDLAKSLCLQSLEAMAVSALGMVDYSQGRYRDAVSKQMTAIEIQNEIGDMHGSAISLNCLGLISAARGEVREAIDHYCNSLALMREIGDSFRIDQILQNLGSASFALGDNTAATEWCEESLALCEQLGDRSGKCAALTTLGNICSVRGDYAKAREYYTESLSIRKSIGDLTGCPRSLLNLGLNAYFRGEYSTSETFYHESLKIFSNLNDAKGTADSLINLGILAYANRNSKLAEEYYQRSITIFKSIGDANGQAAALVNLAGVKKESRNSEEAKLLYHESLRMREQLGDRRGISTCLFAIAILELEGGDTRNAAQHLMEAMNIRHKMGNWPDVTFCIAGLASVAIKSNEMEKAAILIGAVTNMQNKQAIFLNGPDNDLWEQGVALVKQQLGSETFNSLLEKAFQMSRDEIIEVASTLSAFAHEI